MDSLLLVLPCICFFSFSPDFSSEISSQPFKTETYNFSIQVRNDRLYSGIENGTSPICSSLFLFPFFFFILICICLLFSVYASSTVILVVDFLAPVQSRRILFGI